MQNNNNNKQKNCIVLYIYQKNTDTPCWYFGVLFNQTIDISYFSHVAYGNKI